jgi:hypothetical protein
VSHRPTVESNDLLHQRSSQAEAVADVESRPAPAPAPEANPAPALERELREHGHSFRVEGHGHLAVLVPDTTRSSALSPADRRWLVQVGLRHGFTHLAMEVTGPAVRNGETLSGDQPA